MGPVRPDLNRPATTPQTGITPATANLRQRALTWIMADITSEKNLNPPRRDRTCPRVVKHARHNSYRVKRPGDHGTWHDGPATINLVNLSPLSPAA
jgi:hypothetical protein